MEDVNTGADEFGISFPANARISSVEFGPRDLHVHLDDGGSERIVTPAAVAAIHGASIRREVMHPAPLEPARIVERALGKESVVISEELQYVVALRVSSVGELWYLVADTFNFRKSLGNEAGLVLDGNLRTLLRKLAAFAPQAVLDGFVTALLADLPLPPPLDSLMEFFRVVAR